MPRTPIAPVALLAIALAVSACASPAAGNPDPSLPAASATDATPTPSTDDGGTPELGTDLNACEIVTVADIAAALEISEADVPAGELEAEPTTLSPGRTECRYEGEWGGLIVDLTPEDGANLFDAARGSYADASDREIAGADGAFWSDDNNRGFFWKGNVTVMMQMGFVSTGAAAGDVVTALGQAAIDRVD